MRNACKHFAGIQHKVCEAGVSYDTFRQPVGMIKLPCFKADGAIPCEKLAWPTKEEAAAEDARIQKVIFDIEAGLSPCCGATLDESRVEKDGRYAGTGPRFCSACKAFVYRGCTRIGEGGGE